MLVKGRKEVEMEKMLKITLVKSVILPDNAATRGQIRQVAHLVKVEEV